MASTSQQEYVRLVREKSGLTENDPIHLTAKEQAILNLRIQEYGDKRVAELIKIAGANSQYGAPTMFSLCLILHESVIRQLSMVKHFNEVKGKWTVPEHMLPERAEWLKEFHERHQAVRTGVLT